MDLYFRLNLLFAFESVPKPFFFLSHSSFLICHLTLHLFKFFSSQRRLGIACNFTLRSRSYLRSAKGTSAEVSVAVVPLAVP
jgi:hypothetical protein